MHIENRLRPTIEKPAFITIKDHKENLENNMKCRLINPTKTEIGRVSKYILDRINTDIRSKCKLNQWKNTKDVINWFSQLRQKNKLTFLAFDIIDFYPSISDELLNKSIEWARKHTSIDDQEYETIMHSRRTLLHDNKGNMWTKKEIKRQFDVSMGAFDGAEVCELIGLYMLLSTPLHQRAASRGQHPNYVAANSLSPQVARKGSTLSGFVQRSRLEREVGRDLHSNKWEEV